MRQRIIAEWPSPPLASDARKLHRNADQLSPESIMSAIRAAALITVASMLVACNRGGDTSDTAASSTASDTGMAPGTATNTGTYDSTSASGSAASIKTASASSVGTYLTSADGMALYMFEKDPKGKSACSGACAKAWPPLVGSASAGGDASIKANLLGTTARADNTSQVTYNGMPLYHYADDKSPGDIKGQDKKEFGGSWYVVSPDGKKIEKEKGK
jgi:predicted lipoprotein with Yx(FWY)xxD motif